MAEVSQHLKFVSRHHHFITEHLVVAGPPGALDAHKAQKVEVNLGWVIDAMVHHSASQRIAVVGLVHGEESALMLAAFCL